MKLLQPTSDNKVDYLSQAAPTTMLGSCRATFPSPARVSFFDMSIQFKLGFDLAKHAGLQYDPLFLAPAQQTELVNRIERLPFREFEFHGYLGKRRIVSFGWRYEYSGRGVLKRADEIPDFLRDVRVKAALIAGSEPQELEQALVTEYRPGAGIGWHRDKPVFDRVVGISLLTPCTIRFRRIVDSNASKKSWDRMNLVTQPGSAYVLSGSVREEWEHSILRVDKLRYSVTFRSLRRS